MRRSDIKYQLLLWAVLLGFLWNFPILSVVNRPASVWGVPLLPAYIFITWLLGIAGIAYIVRKKRISRDD